LPCFSPDKYKKGAAESLCRAKIPMKKKQKEESYYDDPSLPEELLYLDDPERLIREGDDTPDTPKKRRQNWMNRNMSFMMGALALMLVLGVLLYTLFLQSGPDYIVGLVTSYTMPEPGRKQLEELLASYADDRNGDGRVMVKLQTYTFVPGTTDQAQREESLLDLQVSLISDECMIFLQDKGALHEVAGEMDGKLQYTDGTAMPQGAKDFEKALIPWGDCKALSAFQPDESRLNLWDPQIYLELCQSLNVTLRGAAGTILADPDVSAYHAASAAFVERLKSGEKP
jgi:hypothetical protein